MVLMHDNFDPDNYGGMAAMFFAGLILLIPHRIGMSRVNYVIKRYNLPISRAGLLLYKYHNNNELSLLCGCVISSIILYIIAAQLQPQGRNDDGKVEANANALKWLMVAFTSLMLLSSIYMFIIYISGGDFGHLNAFYFSLILLTFFDGFANACAFAVNAKYSSMPSAGIPLSGALVTLLHYVYKFFYDSFLWDDFDYYVLRLQLICNIITITATIIIWACSYTDLTRPNDPKGGTQLIDANLNGWTELFDPNKHIYDWSPIGMLAISLGTVYAFYPSISPYSIIDFQYASVIELWILIISASPTLPFAMAILDLATTLTKYNLGPSGQSIFLKPQTPYTLKVQHAATADVTEHPTGTPCSVASTAHDYQKDWKPGDNDKYGVDATKNIPLKNIKSGLVVISNWFGGRKLGGSYRNPKKDNIDPSIDKNDASNDPLYGLWNLACGFAGAGKQSFEVLKGFPAGASDTPLYKTFNSSSGDIELKTTTPGSYTQNKLTIVVSGKKRGQGGVEVNIADGDLTVDTTTSIKIPDPTLLDNNGTFNVATINGTIAATNKLITLFVMMFCVFTVSVNDNINQ